MRRPFHAGLPLLLLAFTLPFPLAAQSGPDLMRRAAAAHEERLAGVENVTIVQDMMGMEATLYMERQDVGGTPTLVPVETRVSGMTVQVPEMNNSQWSSAFQDEWIERTRAEGTELVDGRTLQVLVMDDFTGLDLSQMSGPGTEDMEILPRRIPYLMDPRRSGGFGEMTDGGVRSSGATGGGCRSKWTCAGGLPGRWRGICTPSSPASATRE